MPDTNQPPTPVIQTPQDLAGALAAEAQLERDLLQAHALGGPTTNDELRLENLRDAIAQHQSIIPPPDANPGASSQTNEIRLQSVRDAVMPPPPAETPTVPPPSAAQNTVAPPAPADAKPAAIDGSSLLQYFQDNSTTPPAAPANTPSANAVDDEAQPVFGEDFSPLVAAQTQSLQNSGDRMRAALEQNSLLTNSLFSRTLELLNLQNRKLGEIDRRLNEVHGQMRSLKNP